MIYISLIVSLVQISAYILLDKVRVPNLQIFVFFAILVLYLYPIPSMFLQPTTGPQCGMPQLAIHAIFFVLGWLTTGVTDLIYRYVNKPAAGKEN